MDKQIAVFWFRRDLRLNDNAGLYHALKGKYPVLPVFIFDTEILDELEDKDDARVTFIHSNLKKLHKQIEQEGSGMLVKKGNPISVWKELLNTYSIKAVYTNHDYEPYAIERDQQIRDLLKSSDIPFHTFKDQVIFEKDEVLKDDGDPYTVYTPYMKKWRNKLTDFYLKSYPTDKYFDNLLNGEPEPIPDLKDIGFTESPIKVPEPNLSDSLLSHYKSNRDIPAVEGTSKLSTHLRFGTVSVREVAQLAKEKNDTFLNELVWREFFMQILYHFPHVVNNSFRKKYDQIEWINNMEQFERWCNGQTGFPIVDAGIRELNATGYMHNRVRMIVASFLCKDLLIDWRWGEAYFARKLLDYELASNNGNWQWAAGTGCDAAPYFRVFNPETQTKKFDPKHEYIRKWVPEFESDEYPKPMVDHKEARERALEVYKKAVS